MKRTVQQKLGKKIILSLVAIVGLATINASAQSPTMYLGVNLGPQYTSINSNSETFNGGVGYHGSISAELRFSQQFGVEGQFGISALSATTKYSDSLSYNGFVQRYNNNYTFNTTWLQGHLLAKYYIRLGGEPITPYDRPEGSGNFLYFMAGGYIGLMPSGSTLAHVGRTGTQTKTIHINNSPSSMDVKSDTSYNATSVQEANDKLVIAPTDYGFTVGAGVSLRLSQSASLDFGFTFNDGLVTIDSPDPSLTAFNKKTSSTNLITNGFFLGHNSIVVTNNSPGILYSPANAYNMFIAFNIGLKFKLFGDSY